MGNCSLEGIPKFRSPCPPTGFILTPSQCVCFSLAPRDAQGVDKAVTHGTGKPGFRARAKKHLFVSSQGRETALDKKGVKAPCKYTILGPLDLYNGAGK